MGANFRQFVEILGPKGCKFVIIFAIIKVNLFSTDKTTFVILGRSNVMKNGKQNDDHMGGTAFWRCCSYCLLRKHWRRNSAPCRKAPP